MTRGGRFTEQVVVFVCVLCIVIAGAIMTDATAEVQRITRWLAVLRAVAESLQP